MYSAYNEGKSVVAKRFIRTLKTKIFKHMTAISKNVYFDVLDDSVIKYNNTVHRTVKMKPIGVHLFLMLNTIKIVFNKFKVGDHVRISKHKNIFAKGYAPNWLEEVFVVSKIKNTVLWTYIVSDLSGEENTGSFCEK